MSGWPNPDKPGVPLNSERDGWHWLSWQGGDPRAWEWDAETCPFGDGRAPGSWRHYDALQYGARVIKTPHMLARASWTYIGPCPTPAEADALRAENARLREALEKAVTYVELTWHEEAGEEGEEAQAARQRRLGFVF